MNRNARCVSTRSMSSSVEDRAEERRVVTARAARSPMLSSSDARSRLRKRSRHAGQQRAALRAARAVGDRVRQEHVRQAIELGEIVRLAMSRRHERQRAAPACASACRANARTPAPSATCPCCTLASSPPECANPPDGNPSRSIATPEIHDLNLAQRHESERSFNRILVSVSL